MPTFLAALILFGLVFVALSMSVTRGKRRPGCSCKMAAQIMKEKERADCKSCPVQPE